MPEKLPLVVIACQVFQQLLENMLPPEQVSSITFLDYGLHSVPNKLRSTVQEQIDAIEEPSLILLGYGLCGNGLHKIVAGKHTLLISRTDDCIAIFWGSYRRYLDEFNSNPGTYYLTKGWLESGSNPLKESREYAEKYGADMAEYLMDTQYKHYRRLIFVAHNQADLDAYRPQAEEVAEYCQRWGMNYEEVLGSDAYVRALVEAALSIEKAGDEFIVVPPGGKLTQMDFLR